ncbi:hypothetical protein [Cloacibacillus evryensis]|nr:hypothetical protein [Cloacibacillus evryensis]MCQ4765072.1 hypothetical protein [Cloacibacillus evryensis]
MGKYKSIIAERRDDALAALESQTETVTEEEADKLIQDDKAIAEYMSHTLDELKAMAAERGIEADKNWRKSSYAEAIYSADLKTAETAK